MFKCDFLDYPMQPRGRDDVEVERLVNACLDKSGIDRRYSALIVEELRDCTNLTHDQLRQAAHELTSSLRATSPQYVYDSTPTNLPSSDERLYESSIRYHKL